MRKFSAGLKGFFLAATSLCALMTGEVSAFEPKPAPDLTLTNKDYPFHAPERPVTFLVGEIVSLSFFTSSASLADFSNALGAKAGNDLKTERNVAFRMSRSAKVTDRVAARPLADTPANNSSRDNRVNRYVGAQTPYTAGQADYRNGPYLLGALVGYGSERSKLNAVNHDFKAESFLGGLYGALLVSKDKGSSYSLHANAIFVQTNVDFDRRLIGSDNVAAGYSKNNRLISVGARGDWLVGKALTASLNSGLVYDRWGTDGFTDSTGADYTAADDDSIYARFGGEISFTATRTLRPYALANYRQELTTPAYSNAHGSVEVGGGLRLVEGRYFSATLEATTELLRESRNSALVGGNLLFRFGG